MSHTNKRNRKIISFLVVILGYIMINAGCQTNSGVEVTKEVVFLPTSTPVACADSPAVSLVVSPTASSEVLVVLTGLEPGEPIILIFESSSLTETSKVENYPVTDASGRYTDRVQGLSKLSGNATNWWKVKIIHKHGVNCTSVTLP